MVEEKGMRPIWYFVGLMLVIIGGIIVISGIYNLIIPPAHQTVMYNIYPNFWWGALLVIVGAIYVFKNKNVRLS